MEAILCYDECIQLLPNYIDAYNNKIISLHHLNLNDEAIETTRNISILFCTEGNILHERYNKSITINSNNVDAIKRRKTALRDFYRNREIVLKRF